jgi:hypothetical protein
MPTIVPEVSVGPVRDPSPEPEAQLTTSMAKVTAAATDFAMSGCYAPRSQPGKAMPMVVVCDDRRDDIDRRQLQEVLAQLRAT